MSAESHDEQRIAAERQHTEEGSVVGARQGGPGLAAVLRAKDVAGFGGDVELALRRDGDLIEVKIERAFRVLPDLAAVGIRLLRRVRLDSARLAADSAYGSAEMLGWLVNERAIEPHIPVFDKSARTDGTFAREDFAYDQQSDVYICPAGKVLTSTGTLVNDGATLLYRAVKHDCDACELKPRCCPKMPVRKVPRSIHEKARDVARDIAKTDAYVRSRRERKKIEMLFAHLKRILRLDRLRLRGPLGARDEFLLAATAQNLRKLAKLIPIPALQPA